MGLNVEKMLEGICKPVPLDKNVEKNDESNSSLLTVDEFVQKWNEKKVSEYYKKYSEPNESKVLSEDEMRKIILEYNDACSLVDKFVQDYNKANRVGLYKDNKDDSKTKEESITAFGVKREEFEQMYNETNGFNETCPKDNLSCGSQNMEEFCDFMIRASKGNSDGVIERRKKSVKSLIQDFGKLTPEIESIIDACTSVSEIENIYDEVKATVPKSNDGIIDSIDILNKVSGDKPMTDAEKLEDAQDRKRHALQVKDLTEKEKIRPDVPMTPEAYEELRTSVRKRYKTGNGNKPDNK